MEGEIVKQSESAKEAHEFFPWTKCVMGCKVAKDKDVIILNCFHAICSPTCKENWEKKMNLKKGCYRMGYCLICGMTVTEEDLTGKVILNKHRLDASLACGNCIYNSPGFTYCPTCCMYLCEPCTAYHSRSKSTFKHTLKKNIPYKPTNVPDNCLVCKGKLSTDNPSNAPCNTVKELQRKTVELTPKKKNQVNLDLFILFLNMRKEFSFRNLKVANYTELVKMEVKNALDRSKNSVCHIVKRLDCVKEINDQMVESFSVIMKHFSIIPIWILAELHAFANQTTNNLKRILKSLLLYVEKKPQVSSDAKGNKNKIVEMLKLLLELQDKLAFENVLRSATPILNTSSDKSSDKDEPSTSTTIEEKTKSGTGMPK